MAPIHVTKYSGNREKYDESKLRQSLESAGAPETLIEEAVTAIRPHLHEGVSTQKIYKELLKLLQSFSKKLAGRYRLKEALFELGPSGVHFKKFITKLLDRLEYETEMGVSAQGHCITHNIDVIAQNADAYILVECKFYTRDEQRCSVNVPLYFQSRLQDVKKKWSKQPENTDKIYKGWVITNTRFSFDAQEYGNCVGLKLLSWDFPLKRGIKDLVEYLNLYPVTCLSSLTKEEKFQCLRHDIIFCRQIYEDKNRLEATGIGSRQVDRIAKEAEEICG